MAKSNSGPVNSLTVASAARSGPSKALNLRSSLADPSLAPSAAWIRTAACPRAISSSTFPKPAVNKPALLAMLMASPSRLTMRRSIRAGRSSGNETACFRLRAKTWRCTAAATDFRVASTHTPRPGRRRAKSGATIPSGPRTKRISSSGGLWARETAHRRSGPSAPSSRSLAVALAPITPLFAPWPWPLGLGLCRGSRRLPLRLPLPPRQRSARCASSRDLPRSPIRRRCARP